MQEKRKRLSIFPMVQTYFIVQLIYWQKQSDHQNNLKKETNENSYFAFSQQAPKLLTRGTKKWSKIPFEY